MIAIDHVAVLARDVAVSNSFAACFHRVESAPIFVPVGAPVLVSRLASPSRRIGPCDCPG